ncbi:MAG: aldehyde dehydrogenase (NADP(+)) [Pseudomonadota bacterium]|nr:aldehyde dehydrogenase (NADP(+)) [Pseudomonadota bacterium]
MFYGVEQANGRRLEPAFHEAGKKDVADACAAAEAAFHDFASNRQSRALLLRAIADEISQLGDELIQRASAETGLPVARLIGERARTIAQLRLFADEVSHGGWMGLRIDPGLPDRAPLRRPDLRMRKVPLGPVAVFGASNFPLAFSVAGGDTAAAFAAGCPVVVKGHPAHPGTSEMVASAIARAVEAHGLPAGLFSYLVGQSHETGASLVSDPRIKAVGFTGSRSGGLALAEIASRRPEPIPVYAEMSSVNPVVLFPAALAEKAEILAAEFVQSMTLGCGQFCTNPGLIIAVEGEGLARFIDAAVQQLSTSAGSTMLTAEVHAAFDAGAARLAMTKGVETLARGLETDSHQQGRPALFAVSAGDFLADQDIAGEVFGACSLIIRCTHEGEVTRIVSSLEGQLTITLHFEKSDEASVADLLPLIETKAGRVLANGWPTGVEVSHAMVHGGPFPATSDGRSTSVGTLAIDRFLRPICYQDMPDTLLPQELRGDGGPGLPKRLDGVLQGWGD